MISAVQRRSIPVVLSGTDTVVMARTGSGKTCAFLIPILEKLVQSNGTNIDAPVSQKQGVRAIVLSPTRELSLQTLSVLKKLSHFMDIRSIGIHGAESMEKQFDGLSSQPDVIVATPGRLAHIISEVPDFSLRDCQICVLDEADRLLEMGFAMQLRQIARSLPPENRCQKLLFSATMPKILIEFTRSGFASDPQVVRLDNEATVSDQLRMSFITCRSMEKDAALLQVISIINKDKEENEATRTGLTLIFCATRHHVEYLTTLLRSSGAKATMIYGTLDTTARNSNLASFRNGTTPILCVTDVAARGVDVPLCDHVIHYHFPPTPKLFVHRSGRVARAGRVGFCWSLVDPEEMPYLCDLHSFMGRPLTTSHGRVSIDTLNNNNDGTGHSANSTDTADETVESYTLSSMTTEMVHFGCIPESILHLAVENVRRMMESEMTGSDEANTMKSLAKVCANAMKQYRKSRPEASKEGVRKAKAILEGRKTKTGQRMSNSIPPHPILRGIELAKYQSDESKGKISSLNNIQNIQRREEFLRSVAYYRPKETVFEAFATGGNKMTGVLSQVDKGRTTAASGKKHDTSFALVAMKNMRRQMKMARDKGSALVVAGSSEANAQNQDQDEEDAPNDHQMGAEEMLEDSVTPSQVDHSRRRLTKAERRRMKNASKENSSFSTAISNITPENTEQLRKKNMRDFRDAAFFIESEATSNPEEMHRQHQIEASMQPSASSSIKGIVGNALRLEEAMLDVVGDERDQLVQKQRMMRWDQSKRKYVQTTIGAELSGESRSKRVKLESGQIVKSDKLKLGEIYEKWQKKTNKSVGRTGVFDNFVREGSSNDMPSSHLGVGGRSRGGAKNRKTNDKKGVKDAPEKAKSAQSIKTERQRKEEMRLKNMKKGDRRRITKGSSSSDKAPSGKQKKGGQWKK